MTTMTLATAGDPQWQPAPPPSQGAAKLVTDGFTSAQQYARDAYGMATTFLGEMTATAAGLQNIPSVSDTLAPATSAGAAFTLPALPTLPTGLAMNVPAAPSDPALTAITPLTVTAAPAFTAAMPAIDLNIAVPGALTATIPTAPALNPVAVPVAPSLTLPDVPNLLAVNVPVTPLLNLPTFTAILPGSPQAPANTFAFADSAYTSTLLTDMRARLSEWVNGASTGLAPAVEQAIWDRGRARETALAARKSQETYRSMASRGFSVPPGALAMELANNLQDAQNTLSGVSREVMIKQADLEQTNRRFAFENAWKVEEGLITYQNQLSQRAFETAKYAQQVAVELYHEVVLRYTADIQGYAAQVDAYKSFLQAELSKLEIFKTELDAQRLIGTLNTQYVDIYRARLEGVKTLVDVFKAQVDAANSAAMVNKTQIEGYAAQVGAYGETVRAKASEYDMYATRVRTEVAKVEVFKAQADAFSSQINGFRATVDAQIASKNIEIKVNQEVPLELFKTRTEVYRTQVQAEAERVNATVKVAEAGVQVFSAEVQGEAARVNSAVEIVKVDAAHAVAEGNLRIEAAKVNVQKMIQSSTTLIEAIKSGAQVAAQLAASALSSVNLSGQIGDHTSYGVGYNVGNSSSSSFGVSVSTSTSDITTHSA